MFHRSEYADCTATLVIQIYFEMLTLSNTGSKPPIHDDVPVGMYVFLKK
jgi:hypothetical protein